MKYGANLYIMSVADRLYIVDEHSATDMFRKPVDFLPLRSVDGPRFVQFV